MERNWRHPAVATRRRLLTKPRRDWRGDMAASSERPAGVKLARAEWCEIKRVGHERGCVSCTSRSRFDCSVFGQSLERCDAAAAGPQTDSAALRERLIDPFYRTQGRRHSEGKGARPVGTAQPAVSSRAERGLREQLSRPGKACYK